MWRVVVPKKIAKEVKKVDKRYKRRIYAALAYLTQDPLCGKKQGGARHRYSIRVWPYRIIYELDKRRKVVLIIRVKHRQGAYK